HGRSGRREAPQNGEYPREVLELILAVAKSLAKPYARALFEQVPEAQRSVWLERLEVLAQVFQDAEVARAVVRAPELAVGWVKSALGNRMDDATYTLLAVLIENGRLASLGDIAEQFAALTREAQGTGILDVTSAVALTEKERAEALKLFEGLFKQKLIPQ